MKPGDRVRITSDDTYDGMVGTLALDDGTDTLPLQVEFEKRQWSWFDRSEVALATEEEA